MCGSMADIQSATVEIRRRKKEEEEETTGPLYFHPIQRINSHFFWGRSLVSSREGLAPSQTHSPVDPSPQPNQVFWICLCVSQNRIKINTYVCGIFLVSLMIVASSCRRVCMVAAGRARSGTGLVECSVARCCRSTRCSPTSTSWTKLPTTSRGDFDEFTASCLTSATLPLRSNTN